MTPDMNLLKLPGIRIDKFPSSKIASVMSKEVEPNNSQISSQPVAGEVAEAVPVVGEVAEAVPVVGEVAEAVPTPVIQPTPVEEEEEMDFDMEWD